MRPRGPPEPVRTPIRIPDLGNAVPYGIYDIAGWVNLDISHDTTACSVESIRRWWYELGSTRYPTAARLLIIADCGGSKQRASAPVEAGTARPGEAGVNRIFALHDVNVSVAVMTRISA